MVLSKPGKQWGVASLVFKGSLHVCLVGGHPPLPWGVKTSSSSLSDITETAWGLWDGPEQLRTQVHFKLFCPWGQKDRSRKEFQVLRRIKSYQVWSKRREKGLKIQTNQVNTLRAVTVQKLFSHNSKAPLTFNPIPREAHKLALSRLRFKTVPAENNPHEQVRWSPLLESLKSRNCDINLVPLGGTFHLQALLSLGRRSISDGRRWPCRGRHQSPGVKDLPNWEKRQGVRERGQRKIKRPLMEVTYLHQRTCKSELLWSLKAPHF